MNQQTTRLTNTELAGILRRGFGGALGRKEQILAYDAHCLLASEAIETLETENTLLSACLVKAEKQRDTLLAALKEISEHKPHTHIGRSRSFINWQWSYIHLKSIATKAIAGKVPS